jgi:pimeloyl-ACP methyl ester carboxylesterase
MECIIKGLSVNYEIKGKGRPVVLLHGYNVDHRLMLGCMEPIFAQKEGYKRIYMDLPGMGRSEGANWIRNSDLMLDIITEFIDNIIPNENFILVGESYGGLLARGLVYKMAEKIDGLFLLCPAIVTKNEDRNVPEHVALSRDEALLRELDPQEAEGFTSMNVVQTRRVWDRYREEILAGVALGDRVFLDSILNSEYVFSFDCDKLPEKFRKPALFLMGRQDSCVGYKDAWNILDNYPRATFAILDKAGHNLQIEQAELMNSLVVEWLERVSEF